MADALLLNKGGGLIMNIVVFRLPRFLRALISLFTRRRA
jgi:hypothetical protein